MANLDDILSIVIFVMFFAMTITYFSTISKPDRVELGLLAGAIADKLLTPGYLTWNITKTGIFINATSSQNLYPIDLYMPFPGQTKPNSVRVRYHNDGKDVGFVYANTSTGEFAM